MKALMLDPGHRATEPIDITDHADIARLIGYGTIGSDAVGARTTGCFSTKYVVCVAPKVVSGSTA